jgi:hypothetical protein
VDRTADNVGLVGGRPRVIDPGAVDVTSAFAGDFQPVARAAEPSAPMSALLQALGARGRMRAGMVPEYAGSLGEAGGLGGAGLGSLSRR